MRKAMRDDGGIEKINARKSRPRGMRGREREWERLTRVELVAGEAGLAQLGGLGQQPRSPPLGAAGLDHPPPPIDDGRDRSLLLLLLPPPILILGGGGYGVVVVTVVVVVVLHLIVDATALGCVPVQTGGTRWIVVVRHFSLYLSLPFPLLICAGVL